MQLIPRQKAFLFDCFRDVLRCMQIDEAPIGAVHLCEDVDADYDAFDAYNWDGDGNLPHSADMTCVFIAHRAHKYPLMKKNVPDIHDPPTLVDQCAQSRMIFIACSQSHFFNPCIKRRVGVAFIWALSIFGSVPSTSPASLRLIRISSYFCLELVLHKWKRK